MRKPSSLRVRVALAVGAAIAIATVLLGVAVIAVSEREDARSRDAALRAGATQVAQLSASAPALLTAPGALEGRVGSRRLLIEVVDSRGRIVARSASLGGGVLGTRAEIADVIASGRARFSNTRRGGEPLRLYRAPLARIGSGAAAGGAVLVATATQADEQTAHHIRVLVLLAAAGAALLAIAIALLLTRRALRPLTDLSAAARTIGETGDPTQRLPPAGSKDEVGALSETLNAMLASLERAREAERRFVADASHELRTPLTALRGNAAYIARHGADPAVLADIEAGAERLSELLDDLLALAREDAAAPARGEPVQLADLAQGADEVVIERDVWVSVERPAFERAVDNLVRNARKHGQGRVKITVGGEDGSAFIRVSDEGPGIPPAEAKKAFERFWRGSAARGEGSGLGLAIVRAIAERHGGRIEIDGATFTLSVKELSKSARTTAAR